MGINETIRGVGWCLRQHEKTSHLYDKYIPYGFHLRMVARVAEQFKEFAPVGVDVDVILLSCYGHDLIEDTRTSYNDVKQWLGREVADIVYALTNEKGRNRAERGNQKYYDGIKATPGAVFVKLCDRIANAQYSSMSGSSMREAYIKENPDFLKKLEPLDERYKPMVDYLAEILSENNKKGDKK